MQSAGVGSYRPAPALLRMRVWVQPPGHGAGRGDGAYVMAGVLPGSQKGISVPDAVI